MHRRCKVKKLMFGLLVLSLMVVAGACAEPTPTATPVPTPTPAPLEANYLELIVDLYDVCGRRVHQKIWESEGLPAPEVSLTQARSFKGTANQYGEVHINISGIAASTYHAYVVSPEWTSGTADFRIGPGHTGIVRVNLAGDDALRPKEKPFNCP